MAEGKKNTMMLSADWVVDATCRDSSISSMRSSDPAARAVRHSCYVERGELVGLKQMMQTMQQQLQEMMTDQKHQCNVKPKTVDAQKKINQIVQIAQSLDAKVRLAAICCTPRLHLKHYVRV
eukprot:SAG31_NODE_7884_length_1574_cov_1.173559_1_plen_122_part_00